MPIAPWSETAPQLVDVAMGRAPADMLIRNGRWVNVHSGEVIPGTDVAIKAGRFAAIGPDLGYTVGDATVIVEAEDRYMVPGLCDGHMHVEGNLPARPDAENLIARRNHIVQAPRHQRRAGDADKNNGGAGRRNFAKQYQGGQREPGCQQDNGRMPQPVRPG